MGSPKSAYFRSEVDGLRAVAVLAIFAFHLELPGFGGGFVGVDIFFVISGYVITMGIMRELDAGTFSLWNFYVRRLRRIMPALLIVLLATLAAGFIILSPREFKELADSAAATLVFAANFFFHDRTGYFAGEAHTRPLLHMWSLGVEEQFYIFVPLIVSGLRRFRGINPLTSILAIVILSFVYGVVAITISEKHAFYMPMARFWEIGVGGAVASAERYLSISGRLSGLLAGLGLAAILGSVALLDNTLAFPGWYAAIPVLGTAAVIAFARLPKSWVAAGLSWSPMLAIGAWSYSIYLVHWPLIVYWRLWVARPLEVHEQATIFVLVILLAALLSRLVERPMRAGSGTIANKPALLAITSVSAVVLGLAAFVSLGKGMPSRLNTSAREVMITLQAAEAREAPCTPSKSWLGDPRMSSRVCHLGASAGRVDFVIWGDSHAGRFTTEVLDRLSRLGMKNGVLAGLPDCFPLHGIYVGARKNNALCPAFVEAVIASIQRDKPRVVVIAARWANAGSPVRAPGDGAKSVQLRDLENGRRSIALADALTRTIERLNTQVILVGPVPEIEFDVSNTLVRALQGIGSVPAVLRSEFDVRQSVVLEQFARIRTEARLAIVYPHSVLCNREACAVADGIRALYIDDDHLSPFGSALVSPLIEQAVAK